MPKPPPTLTPRRQHVLAGTARGHSRRQIGQELGYSESTVHDDLRTIGKLLRAPQFTRAGIVARAYMAGLLDGLPPERRPIVLLTPAQRLVLEGVALGLTNRQIGTRLYRTESTVHSHMLALLAKFDAKDRAHLVALAFQQGHLRRSDFPQEAQP